ncbi:MAG: glycosyltransferase family 39 protein [Candidatus Aminicenantes bacterium]|nr:glycosyltransferase family 39 protein [Candidatus Aminicenantes bacterium]
MSDLIKKTQWYNNDLFLPGGLAFLKILIHLPILTRYGYHQDELYFLACGKHLAFGYVDHAPLVPWIAWLSETLFPQSLFALRFLPLLAGAAAVFMTGILVKKLGGGKFAQFTASIAMIIAPSYLRMGNILSLPSFEPLFWVTGFYLVVKIIQEDNPKLWIWVGVVTGIGLLNKHSMLFFGFGLVAGMILTPIRKYFRSPWLYAGGILALLMLTPNLIWQFSHDWPTFKFMLNLNERLMSGISPFQFITGQFLYLHPFNAILWIWGLKFFLFSNDGKKYRLLGWAWLFVFGFLLIFKSKIYYLAPAYPILFAGGTIALERYVYKKAISWLKPVFISLLVIFGMLMSLISLPVLNIDKTEKFVNIITFGAFENIYELTSDLRGMFGWKEMVKGVGEVYNSLPEEEKEKTIILAAGYGNAGAIDHFGKRYGLPKACSLSMTYWLWGFPDKAINKVIGAGFKPETMKKLFNNVEIVAEIELKNANPWQTPFPVTICSGPKPSLANIWERNRPW